MEEGEQQLRTNLSQLQGRSRQKFRRCHSTPEEKRNGEKSKTIGLKIIQKSQWRRLSRQHFLPPFSKTKKKGWTPYRRGGCPMAR
jgi:hypothetical protein